MSDGLRRLAGSPLPATINGKTYTLEPISLAMLAELESAVVAARPNILLEVMRTLSHAPESCREKALDIAMQRQQKAGAATAEESGNYIQSLRGVSHVFWMMARKAHPELETLDDAVAVVGQVPLAEIKVVTDFVGGMLDIKNSDGPTVAATDRATAA